MKIAKQHFVWFFIVSSLTFLTSCVDSRNPACAEKDAKIDEQLIGNWTEANDLGIWKMKKSEDVGNALVVDIPDSDRLSGYHSLMAFCTTIKSKGYLSVRSESEADGKDRKNVKYDIYQYKFSDNDTLLVCGMAEKVIIEAIHAKQLAGTVEKDDDGEETPEITDTTEGIIRYLEAHADECFSDKSDQVLKFKRQK